MPKRPAADEEEEAFVRGKGSFQPADQEDRADDGDEHPSKAGAAASSKKGGKKARKKAEPEDEEPVEALPERFNRVNRLRTADLDEGSLIVAAVREVNEEEITLDLPFNLQGYVQRAQAIEMISPVESSRSSLPLLYPPGKLVVAVVTAIVEITAKRQRIELSLRPALANAGLTTESLQQHMWLPAAVSGEEEHVVKLDFGVEKLQGLLKKSELAQLPSVPGAGTILMVAVQAVNVVSGTVRCSLFSSEPISAEQPLEQNLLKAGLLVSARVRKFFSGDDSSKDGAGLLTHFCGSLQGLVQLHHLGSAVAKDTEFKKNQRVTARILAVVPGTPALVHLTLLPHLLDWTSQGDALPLAASIGDRLEGEILDFKHKFGARLRCHKKTDGKKGVGAVPGFCAASRLADKDADPSASSVELGFKSTYRVLAYNFLDGLMMLTRRPADLQDGVLVSVSELSPGQLVTGTVTRLADHGVFVKLSDYVSGHVHLRQLTDVPLPSVPKRIQVESKLKCRVMHVDTSRRQITLTAKKSLVKDECPLTSNADAKADMLVTGYVSGIHAYGAIVSFYGGAFGLIPKKAMDADEAPALGMAVRCRVTIVDAKRNRLLLSLNLDKGRSAAELKDSEVGLEKSSSSSVSAGGLASEVHVLRCSKEGVLVRFASSDGAQHVGYVPTPHLADDLDIAKARHDTLCSNLGGAVDLNIDESSDASNPGVNLPEEGVILARRYHPDRSKKDAGQDTGGCWPLLSLKQSMRLAVDEGSFVSKMSELQPGRLYAGYVKEIKEFGALISVGAWMLSGVASKVMVAAKKVENISDELMEGQSVRVLVSSVNEEKKRFDADLRPGPVPSSDVPLLVREAEVLRRSFNQKEALLKASTGKKLAKKRPSALSPGSLIDATITSVEDYGVLLSVPAREGLTAVALKENMPKDFISQAGSSVKCAVLDFDPESGIADVSLQPALLGISSDPSAAASRGAKRKSKASTEATAAQARPLQEGQKIAVLPALQKKGYSVLWCQDPPAVVFAPPFGATKWNEPRQTTVHSVLPSIGEVARNIVLCPADGKERRAKVPKILNPEQELQAGSPVKMRLRSIKGLQVFCTAPVGLRGHLHATQFFDLGEVGSGGESPLEGMRKAGVLEARMLRMQQRSAGPEDTEVRGDKVWHLEMSIKPSLMEPKDVSEYEAAVVRWSNLKPGKILAGAVLSAAKNIVWMEVAPGIKGRVLLLDASSDPSVLKSLADHFHPGQVFQTRVLRAVKAQKELDLSLLPTNDAKVSAKSGPSVRRRLAKLQKIDDNGSKGMVAIFQLPERRRATAHITELFDVWVKQPTKRLKLGNIYEVAVLRDWHEAAPEGLEGRAEVSLRPSLVLGRKEAEEERRPPALKDLTVGSKVSGYVLNASPKGIFVALSRSLVARIKLKSISDRPVMKDAVAKLYPPGTLIRDAKVVELDNDAGRVELSLRSAEGSGKMTAEHLSVGDIVSGKVKAVEPYGLFVRLDNSSVDAMVHKSEISDSASISVESYQVGTAIARAKVIKIDGRKISLTVKPSSFDPGELDEEDGEDEDSDDIQDLIATVAKEKKEAKRKRDEESAADPDDDEAKEEGDEDMEQDEDEAEEEPKAEQKKAKKKLKKSDAETKQSPEDSDEEPWKHSSADVKNGLSAASGFDFAEFKVNEASSSDEDADDGDVDKKKKISKRQKKAKKLAEQQELQQQEAENADGQWAEDPRSVEDFERLLLTEGDTSIVWIRYMAFHLKMSDLEKARQVAERAVKHVGFAETKERFNVWVAYMNLECTFGSDDSADALFRRAASHNDAKQVYLQLARIHERNKKPELAAKAHDACTRKFPHSKKVWIAFLTFLYQQQDTEGSHKLLPKSLAALPKRKHPVVVTKAALLEYQFGSPERGRSIFEGLLDSYPKRTDLWSIYLDAHIKAHTPPKVPAADFQEVRALMERCCAMKLKATKMRFFFKRWLDFEKKWGDADSQEIVRKKAREFVESQAS
eukprot:TRINITY_DN26206_c0_g1_i1.p1 TRINITY_DN26206_c0_g1~~TRINITY_DN26206_c0_g1_i1.p1  ORF type:complete len:1998 (+),score=467.03 TRINITY_DN26206_c0_g1_i1:33-5996(+)